MRMNSFSDVIQLHGEKCWGRNEPLRHSTAWWRDSCRTTGSRALKLGRSYSSGAAAALQRILSPLGGFGVLLSLTEAVLVRHIDYLTCPAGLGSGRCSHGSELWVELVTIKWEWVRWHHRRFYQSRETRWESPRMKAQPLFRVITFSSTAPYGILRLIALALRPRTPLFWFTLTWVFTSKSVKILWSPTLHDRLSTKQATVRG